MSAIDARQAGAGKKAEAMKRPKTATVWLGCPVCREERRVVLREGRRLARSVRHCGGRWEIEAEGFAITALQWMHHESRLVVNLGDPSPS
jgi:hypothetical protein